MDTNHCPTEKRGVERCGRSIRERAAGACRLSNLPALLMAPAAVLILALFATPTIGEGHYVELQSGAFILINAGLSDWPLFWRNVTELGDALVLFPFLSFLIYRNPRIWVALFGAVPLSALLSATGKHLASIPRPAAVLAPDQFHALGPALTAHNSLPSGHTITIFAVVTVVVASLVSFERGQGGWRWVVAGFAFASVVGLSRVAVGAHWPLDVVAGATFGIVGGASGVALIRRFPGGWRWLLARRAQTAFGVVMILWGLVLGNETVVDGRHELVLPWLAALCAIAVGVYLLFATTLFHESTRRTVVPRPSPIVTTAVETKLEVAD